MATFKSADGYRAYYKDISGNLTVAAATGDTTLVSGKTNNTIYIQRIIFYVTTSAAQSMSFEDSNSSAFQLANIPASPTINTRIDIDFGDEGYPLTEEKDFLMNVSAAGLAGNLKWYGYMKRTKIASA